MNRDFQSQQKRKGSLLDEIDSTKSEEEEKEDIQLEKNNNLFEGLQGGILPFNGTSTSINQVNNKDENDNINNSRKNSFSMITGIRKDSGNNINPQGNNNFNRINQGQFTMSSETENQQASNSNSTNINNNGNKVYDPSRPPTYNTQKNGGILSGSRHNSGEKSSAAAPNGSNNNAVPKSEGCNCKRS